MKKILMAVVLMGVLIFTAGQAQAITYIDRPAWEAAVVTFQNVDGSGTIYQDISSLALPYGETLSLSGAVNRRQLGSGWATWSAASTPSSEVTPYVFYTNGPTSITGTFSSPVYAFGLEMEPNPFSVHNMTLSLSDGTQITQAVDGNAGAEFFGWSGVPVISMTMSSDVDFAFGRMVQGQGGVVPEPTSMMLLGSGLLGLIGLRRKTA